MKQRFQLLHLRFAIILILMSISSLVAAQWIKKSNALKYRSELGSVVYNGKLYAFLGFRNYSLNVETSSEVYDPLSNTWKLLTSMPSNKSVTHQGMALIDDKVWIIGGRVGTNPGALTSEIWIYNISKNSWSSGPQIKDPATGIPIKWAAGGAVFLGRTLHLFGGFINNGCDNDQEKYHLTLDVDDWLLNPSQAMLWKNDLAPLPVKRNHFGTVILGGKIYAIGGQFGHDCSGGSDKEYSHVYNPAANSWAQLPMLPSPRSHVEASIFALDGKIYIAGGQGADSKTTKLVTIFDPAGNNGIGSWKDDNNLILPASYEGLSAKVIKNTFIISHGGAGGSRYPKNTTYTRTLSRSPVYKLGFPSECLNLNNSSASSLKGKTWLYTIDGIKTYTTSSNASWLVVSKNATGTATPNAVDIEVTADISGLSAGNYTAEITATGSGSDTLYTEAKLCVNLTVQELSEISEYSLTTTANGDGTIIKSPDLATYGNGSNVILTAQPASGQQFSGWSGSASGITNPLVIEMNADKTINANFTPTEWSNLITNLTTTTTKSYAVAQLTTNVNYYTDRTYYITSVPAFLNLAPFIKTPNDDKTNSSPALMQFNLSQSATVYVAYDPRASALPSWLTGWQKTTSTLGITDATLTYFDLYSKTFPAGNVTLGGNLASPAVGSRNNYIVIAVIQPPQSAQRSSGIVPVIRIDKTGADTIFSEINESGAASNSKVLSLENREGLGSPPTKCSIPGIKIYPNPSYGRIVKMEIANLPKHQKLTIVVSDIFGKVYQILGGITDASGELNKSINFDRVLLPGIYLINISSSSINKFTRVIVK